MFRSVQGVLATTLVSVGLVACGSDKPNIDQIKKDFDSPSGSIQDKNAVIAAGTKQSASGPAVALGGSFSAGSLTAADAVRGLNQLNVRRNWELPGKYLLQRMQGVNRQELSAAQFDDGACGAEAQQAYLQLASGKSSASYSVDLSTCSNGEMTGSISVKMEIEGNETSGRFNIEQELKSVCEVAGDKACVDGWLVMELSLEQTGPNAGRFEIVTGWDLNATWTDNGVQQTGNLRGGLRTKFEGSEVSGNASLEYLVYVTTPDGKEYSFVLEISANSEGAGTLSIRGSDGELTCTFNADNSGSCTATGSGGSGSLTWTAEEGALGAEWFE